MERRFVLFLVVTLVLWTGYILARIYLFPHRLNQSRKLPTTQLRTTPRRKSSPAAKSAKRSRNRPNRPR